MVKAGYMRKRRWKEVREGQRKYIAGHRAESIIESEDEGLDFPDLEYLAHTSDNTGFTTGSGGKEDERRQFEGNVSKGMVKNSHLHNMTDPYHEAFEKCRIKKKSYYP